MLLLLMSVQEIVKLTVTYLLSSWIKGLPYLEI